MGQWHESSAHLAADNQSRILRRMQNQQTTLVTIWLVILGILYVAMASMRFGWGLPDAEKSIAPAQSMEVNRTMASPIFENELSSLHVVMGSTEATDQNRFGGVFRYPVSLIQSAKGWFRATHQDSASVRMSARMYVVIWGFLGVAMMFAVGMQLGGIWTGLLSATLYVLLPLVFGTSHEGSPRLPLAVATLCAVWFATQALDRQKFRNWAMLFVACGACIGMTLTALPVLLLIPVSLGLHCRHQHFRQTHELPTCSNRHVDYRPVFLRASAGGLLVAVLVFALTNPLSVYGLITRQSSYVLNCPLSFSNLATFPQRLQPFVMFTVEGTTIPVVIAGVIGTIAALCAKRHMIIPLLVAAMVSGIELLIAGTDTDSDGRFSIFYQLALVIGAAWFIVQVANRYRALGIVLAMALISWCGFQSADVLQSLDHPAKSIMASNS